MNARLRTSIVVAVGALSMAACTSPGGPGGAGSSAPQVSTTSDEEGVVAFLEEFVTSDDPEQCTRWYTDRALEQLTGSTEPRECIEAVTQAEPSTGAEITDVVVDDGRASARVVPEGGDSAGFAMTVELVAGRPGSHGWQVDQYTEVQVVDRASIDAAHSAVIQQIGPSLMAPDKVDCVENVLQQVPDEEIAASVLDRTSAHPVVGAIVACLGGGVDLAAVLFLSEYQLTQGGIPPETATCLAGLAIRGYGSLTVEQIVLRPQAREQWFQALRDAASEDVCVP